MANYKISNSVIKRLPRYYRFLGELISNNVPRISSGSLATKMGITASQIRQDLNCFGGFGQQGYGYNIDILQEEIAYILGLDKPKSIILIGVGNLGPKLPLITNCLIGCIWKLASYSWLAVSPSPSVRKLKPMVKTSVNLLNHELT